jgi:hypothetical protein
MGLLFTLNYCGYGTFDYDSTQVTIETVQDISEPQNVTVNLDKIKLRSNQTNFTQFKNSMISFKVD